MILDLSGTQNVTKTNGGKLGGVWDSCDERKGEKKRWGGGVKSLRVLTLIHNFKGFTHACQIIMQTDHQFSGNGWSGVSLNPDEITTYCFLGGHGMAFPVGAHSVARRETDP